MQVQKIAKNKESKETLDRRSLEGTASMRLATVKPNPKAIHAATFAFAAGAADKSYDPQTCFQARVLSHGKFQASFATMQRTKCMPAPTVHAGTSSALGHQHNVATIQNAPADQPEPKHCNGEHPI